MAGNAKERLERLLGELDRSAETPAGEDPELDDYPDYDEGESSVSEMTAESDVDEARARRRAEKAPGGVYTSRLESKVMARTSKLEERIAALLEENKRKDALAQEALAAKEREFAKERAKMLEAVQLLKDKHSELERLAPPLREAIAHGKEQLRSVVCSQERLRELQSKDPSELSLQEFAVLRVHQETANLRAELDVPRVERDGARDQLGRLELDNQRLTRESKRALEHVAQSDKESEAERSALESRCQRLALELEDAMVKVEVLSAKGAMYDEVAATVDRLGRRAAEAEKELAAAKGAEESLRRERDSAASKLATREHQVELLSQDKAYLSREVDAAQERERKHEEEEDRLREKVRALRTARDALQEKVMSGHAEVRSQHEERLAEEVRRLQTKAGEDLERLREEHAAARDREIRALRDLRDAAVNDATSARAELADLRRGYDDLLSSHRESMKNADVSHAEITGQLRMKSMELERVTMLHGESTSVAKVLRLEVEMLTKKVRLLESQYMSLEAAASRRKADADMHLAEQAARLEHYEGLERELDEAVMHAASEGAGTGDVAASSDSVASALGALGSSVPASLRRRLAQNVALGRRCNELERQAKLANEAAEAAKARAEDLELQLRRANSKAHDASQPYNYLVERIAATEADADAAAAREREAAGKLEDAKAAAHAARAEANALREDLKRALDERGELATIKNMLKTAPRAGSNVGARKAVRA